MGRKKTRAADIKRRLNEEEKFPSPFASIKLVEKKEEEKKTAKKPLPPQKPKKPSEIVQGYNPSSSFADILYAYEHTGNPYVMPSSSRKKEIAESRTDFGAILEKWEGRGKPQKKKTDKTGPEKKSTYHPTKSFGDILAAFDGSDVKKDDRSAAPAKQAEPIPEETFFRQESEDEKRSPDAAWSIFGSNESFVRKEKEEEKEELPPQIKVERVSKPYNPTKSFADILSSFENSGNKKKAEEEETKIAAEKQNPFTEEKQEESLFRTESEDEKRAPEAVWSIFGNNKIPERKAEEQPDEEVIRHDSNKADTLQSIPSFGPVFSAFEKKNEKTFDEILKEKGDLSSQKKELTISRLRTMMPQATLDLHGDTIAQAESSVKSFLDECHQNGLRKISIITGKGLHSEDGIGVLRDAVIRILDQSGMVSEKYSAPQSAGGSGALWIILKA